MNNYTTRTKEIHDILLTIGIPTHLNGFVLATSAIEIALANPDEMQKYTGLYAEVACRHKTTVEVVERGIRHAIKVAYEKGNALLIDKLSRYSVEPGKRPTNAQFISRICFFIAEREV